MGEPNAFRARRSAVLVVEDDEAVREAIAETVERAGYRVATASHGGDALAYLERAEPAPDVVVLDLMMPVVDGWAVLRHMRERLPTTPVVVLSAARKAQLPAEVSFVLKPPTRERLLDAIGQRCPPQILEAPAKVEATLYVRAGCARSGRARAVYAAVLASYEPDEVACDVIDVERASRARLERDVIFETPTLIIRRPLPLTVLGGPSSRTFLMGLFDMAEVQRRR